MLVQWHKHATAKTVGFLTRGNVVRRARLEEFSMVVFLCNNNNKLGGPLVIKKFAGLEIQTNMKSSPD